MNADQPQQMTVRNHEYFDTLKSLRSRGATVYKIKPTKHNRGYVFSIAWPTKQIIKP